MAGMTMDPRDTHGRFGALPRTESSPSLQPVEPEQREKLPAGLLAVLESAARLQQVVPDAVLVGGTVSAAYAGHRLSFDHDHVLDLKGRYEAILDAVEATDGWATSVRASKPPMTIMGKLGGIEAGLRQLRRTVPLQTQMLTLPSGHQVQVPTVDEALRVKAYLVVQRNYVRDYLDVAALADLIGLPEAARVLGRIDDFYADRSNDGESVATEVTARLARPEPRDTRTIAELPRYKALTPRWQDWAEVRRVCVDLAQRIVEGVDDDV